MKLFATLILTISCIHLGPALAANTVPITVKIDLVEALSPKDTTSSLRFQNEFDQAIRISTDRLKNKASKCGYSLESSTSFFDANDPLQAKEKAEKSIQNGAWVIIGPRRSNHYILLAKGSGDTPTISLMASATEIGDLGPRHISLSPKNSEMAKAAAIAARARTKKTARYVTVVSEDCLSCVDFAQVFEQEATKLGLSNSGVFKIKGETPDLQEITDKVSSLNPDFILVPNFSKVSAQVISAIGARLKNTLFVGSDGWGDSNFGFLQNDPSIQTAKGITTRGFPPVEQALSLFPLGKEVLMSKKDSPTSGPGVAILKAFDGITEILCETKPKNRDAFAKAFEKRSIRKLSAPFGVSLYQLKQANISYESKASLK